jgi:hypothetical protein
MAFLAEAGPEETWPFLRTGIEQRPLDAVATMGSDLDGAIAWLTLADYADAWRDAARVLQAIADQAALRQVAGLDDIPDPPPKRVI